MKRIIKNIAILLVAVTTLSIHSCDFLNVSDYFEETMKYDSIFSNKDNIERYLWATAAMFPDEGNFHNSFGSFVSDEIFSVHPGYYPGMNFTLGEVTPTNTLTMTRWSSMYIIIRKTNTIIANLDKAYDMTSLDRREILGYAYFMRAYAYYILLMQYGPLVILNDDVLETNEEIEYYDRARRTYDETVDYICAEFEKAATYMPSIVPVSFFGRPTSGSALGLVARLRLIQASPLWNGGSAAIRTFGTWKRTTDDVHYVSQTPDEKKWAIAAMACKRIIDLGMYQLHTVAKLPDTYTVMPLPANVSDLDFPYGAGNIDPFRSYSDIFTGEALMTRNPEYLWARNSSSLVDFTRHSFPYLNINGWGTISLPQKVVDAYRMLDGRTIEDSSIEYRYTTTGTMGGSNKIFSGYRLNSQVSNMYVNREMRFYASIGFCEAFWYCNSTANNNKKNQTFTYYSDGNAGKSSAGNYINNYNISGYTLKKYVHDDDSWGDNTEGTNHQNSQRIAKAYPIIRYAEILLSYVEALNNLTTSYSVTDDNGNSYTFTRNTEEMKSYYNMIRFRAGLPGLTDAELASTKTMQDLIERERMVEFLVENIRQFDVRRWGKYEISESAPIMGMDIEADRASGAFYNVVPIGHSRVRDRIVDKKLILFPIELDEIRKSPSLDQNPGWQY